MCRNECVCIYVYICRHICIESEKKQRRERIVPEYSNAIIKDLDDEVAVQCSPKFT